MIISRQVLLRLYSYISVCPTLQLSHSGVPGVGLGWVLEPGGPESFPLLRIRAKTLVPAKWLPSPTSREIHHTEGMITALERTPNHLSFSRWLLPLAIEIC